MKREFQYILNKWKKRAYSVVRSSALLATLAKSPRLANLPLNRILLNARINKINNSMCSLPPKLVIENTNACNAACTMCLHKEMVRKKGIMDIELFRRIVDEYATSRSKTRIQMNATGEPLLDPYVVERIKYAKERGIEEVFLFTNGSLLGEQLSKEILESGLDYAIISLDGVTKETYEKIRRNLKFETTMSNIQSLFTLRQKMGSTKPKIELHLTVVDDNKSEVNEFVKKMKKHSDLVTVTYAHNWAGQLRKESSQQLNKTCQMMTSPCRNLWSDLVILWDGRVALCCLDYEGKVILGDLGNESLEGIWRGSKLQKLRESHLKRQFSQFELCGACTEHIWATWWLDYWANSEDEGARPRALNQLDRENVSRLGD